jgi:hypothetical protein
VTRYITTVNKAITLQALTGPEGSRRLRFPDFKTIGTWRWQGALQFSYSFLKCVYILRKEKAVLKV